MSPIGQSLCLCVRASITVIIVSFIRSAPDNHPPMALLFIHWTPSNPSSFARPQSYESPIASTGHSFLRAHRCSSLPSNQSLKNTFFSLVVNVKKNAHLCLTTQAGYELTFFLSIIAISVIIDATFGVRHSLNIWITKLHSRHVSLATFVQLKG